MIDKDFWHDNMISISYGEVMSELYLNGRRVTYVELDWPFAMLANYPTN